jgi:hypothetical protein
MRILVCCATENHRNSSGAAATYRKGLFALVSGVARKNRGPRRRRKHYLKWEDYLGLMPELSEDLMRDYANHLTFLGVCQFFPEDAILRNYVFLRPKWLIDALFDLILHPSLEESRGYFSENDTFNIWKDKAYDGMHALLVRMMKELELCYRVT